MPPALATFLCAIFILLLFYCNSKETRGVSPSSWVPTIWVALMGSRPLGSWLSGTNTGLNFSSALDGSAVDRNVLLILIFLGVAILAKRGLRIVSVLKENPWLFLFYLYWLFSVLWSDDPFVAFKRWIRDASCVAMIFVILTEENPEEALRQVFLRSAYLLIPLSVLTMKYFITIGRSYDQWSGAPCLCGLATDKNALGRLAMVSGLFLLWSLSLQRDSSWLRKIRSRWFDSAVLALCLMILAEANSKTSLFCFGLGAFIFFMARRNWLKATPQRLVFFGCMLIALSALFFFVPDLRGIVTNMLHRNVNLTERTDVWAGCLGLGTNPIIGAGFASVWLTPAAMDLGKTLQIGEAHNGYLEIYLNGGIIGLCVLLPVLITGGKNVIWKLTGNRVDGPLFACLFFAGLIYNYTEAAFDNGSLAGFVLWIVAIRHRMTAANTVEAPDETHPQPIPVSNFALLLAKERNCGGKTEFFRELDRHNNQTVNAGNKNWTIVKRALC